MELSEHFGKFTCKTLKSELGITTVEEARSINEAILLGCKGIGPMFIYHLNQIELLAPDYVRGWNDALIQAAKVVTDNYQKCITQRQIDILNLTKHLNTNL